MFALLGSGFLRAKLALSILEIKGVVKGEY
jgi:hypothetical protein